MEIDKERSDEALKRGVLYGFCPKHLVVEGRNELWAFPHNIMFMNHRGETDGSVTAGTALYQPDLSTFRENAPLCAMQYKNQYGGDGIVFIIFNRETLSYTSEKFINSVSVGSADGSVKTDADKGWQTFFFHLTMLGLSKGERCEFSAAEKKA